MRHGLHHGACAMPLDRLVEVAGGKPEPVCLLAGLDLTLGSLIQAGRVLVGLFVLVRPCSLECSLEDQPVLGEESKATSLVASRPLRSAYRERVRVRMLRNLVKELRLVLASI
jgi:hypothetical protein